MSNAAKTKQGKEERPRSSEHNLKRETRTLLLLFLFPILAAQAQEPASPDHEILLIVGAPGEASYAERFVKAAAHWKSAASEAQAIFHSIGIQEFDSDDRTQIQTYLQNAETQSHVPLWIVYLGHGTHSSRDNLLNLRGPDLDLSSITKWLQPFKRPLIVIHGGSASAPFIPALSGPNRIIITATRSAEEINYTRFGELFSQALRLDAADLNQDEQISLLEAFLFASNLSQNFYQENGRLSSEHSLIDDNGDAVGTPHDWFIGTRIAKRSADNRLPDGFQSHQITLIPSLQESLLTPDQRSQRNQLERDLETLRQSKNQYPEDNYYQKLEEIFETLSKIYLSQS